MMPRMKKPATTALLLATAIIIMSAPHCMAEPELPTPPAVVKKGTIDLDLCETSPFVFKDKLYRLEWHRKAGRLRIMDHATQTEVSHFGEKHRFPCVFVEGDTVHVYGTKEDRGWFGNTLTVFTSTDLLEWKEQIAFTDKDYGICNTSVCKAGDRHVMSIEVNSASKVTNGTFACRFLESKDLLHWTPTPADCRQGFDGGLCSPHLLRWHDGWFYLFSTIGGHPKGYVLLLNRSRDLKQWEPSPFNPVMFAEDADKQIANPKLTPEDRAKIAGAQNRDNSDIDFIDHKGKLVINYCWGNQVGKEFIAEAEFAGTTGQYLQAWYPDERLWRGIDITQPLSTFAKDRSKFGKVLTADGATITSSSGSIRGNALLQGGCADPFAFHTDAERNPWLTIDLGKENELTGILIRNRTDTCQDRAATLRARISSDGRQWRDVWQASGAEPLWEIPLAGKTLKARYVRMEAQPASPVPFHLHHLEVWGFAP